MTGILGREAVYSGKAIDWDAAMKSTTRLGPEKYEFGPYPIARGGHAGTIPVLVNGLVRSLEISVGNSLRGVPRGLSYSSRSA